MFKFFLNLSFLVAANMLAAYHIQAQAQKVAYDIDMARDLCESLPLDNVEGIWLYPDDKVTVLILNERDNQLPNSFDTYIITVVETSDARLHPGDIIGHLYATSQNDVFKIELSTEKKNDYLLKPKSCVATLSKNADAFTIKKQKAPLKTRLNINFNRLLPGFWKIISTGISQTGNIDSSQPPVGMIKIFPDYDGNGSSRRKIRYL